MENRQRAIHAALPARRQAIGRAPSQQHRARTQRQRLDNVAAAPDAAIHQHFAFAAHRFGDLRQGIERGGDPVKLRVAPGTPSGRVLRVKGRGVETSKGTGDLLAEVQVAVPSHLDDDARAALERFHELEPNENPRADLMAKARG